MKYLKKLIRILLTLAYTEMTLAQETEQNFSGLHQKTDALQLQQAEIQRQLDEARSHITALQKQAGARLPSALATAALPDIAQNKPDNHHSDSVPVRIGANFDMLAATRNIGPVEQQQQLSLREVELSLEAQISPTMYGFIFLTWPEEETMNVEEAAVMVDLPWGGRIKAGKYRNEFGMLNTIHEPERPQISLPLPIVEFLGKEQLRESAIMLGQAFDIGKGQRAGVSISLLNANNEVAFNKAQSRDKAYSGKLYYGLETAQAAFQLGASALTGKNNAAGTLATNTQALDFQIMIDPRYNQGYDYPARFSMLGELLFNQREISQNVMNNARGFWGVADYQITHGHHAGVGAEYSEGLSDNTQISKAYSAHYIWYYTPHSRVQLQARRLDKAEGTQGMELMLQWNVVLGSHSEKPFLNILSADN